MLAFLTVCLWSRESVGYAYASDTGLLFLPKERNQACFQKLWEPSHELVDPICAFFSDMLQVHKLQTKDLKKKSKKERKRNVGVNKKALAWQLGGGPVSFSACPPVPGVWLAHSHFLGGVWHSEVSPSVWIPQRMLPRVVCEVAVPRTQHCPVKTTVKLMEEMVSPLYVFSLLRTGGGTWMERAKCYPRTFWAWDGSHLQYCLTRVKC